MTRDRIRRSSTLLVLVFGGTFLLGRTTSAPLSFARAGREKTTPGAQQSQEREKTSKVVKEKEKSKPIQVRAWEVLTAAVADEKASRRSEAIVALGSVGPRKKAVQLVESGMSDKEVSVREIVAITLGQMKSRASIPKLKESLDDEAPEVSFAAARSLWVLGDRSGRDIFIEVLSGARPPSEGVVKSKLRRFHNPAALALIGAKEAAGALLGPLAFGISVAEELAKDRSASARVLSASLLGEDRDPDTVRELDDALADKNWVVRAAAARALGGTHLPAQVAKLEAVLEDQKDAVRYQAAASIIRLLENSRQMKVSKDQTHSREPAKP